MFAKVSLLLATSALASLVGCSNSGSPQHEPTAPPSSPSVPVAEARMFTCGQPIPKPYVSSKPGDPILLTIRETHFVKAGVAIAIEIRETRPHQILSFPIQPTPLTPALVLDSKIVGTAPQQDSTSPRPPDAQGLELDTMPYRNVLSVTRLCSGTWSDLKSRRSRLQVLVTMSTQPRRTSVSSAAPDVLTIATAHLS